MVEHDPALAVDGIRTGGVCGEVRVEGCVLVVPEAVAVGSGEVEQALAQPGRFDAGPADGHHAQDHRGLHGGVRTTRRTFRSSAGGSSRVGLNVNAGSCQCQPIGAQSMCQLKMSHFEPPRVTRGLQCLRGWSHGKAEAVFTGGSGARDSDRVRSRRLGARFEFVRPAEGAMFGRGMLKALGVPLGRMYGARRSPGVALTTLAKVAAIGLVAQSLGCIPFVPVI